MQEILVEYELFWVPVLVVIISQLLKVLFGSIQGRFRPGWFMEYGGMPSSHTALFTALATGIGLVEGFHSPLFFVSVFVGAAFIRDAVGIRWSLGYHGRVLNELMTTLPNDIRASLPKKLKERLGHKPTEALAGAALGISLAVLLHVLIRL